MNHHAFVYAMSKGESKKLNRKYICNFIFIGCIELKQHMLSWIQQFQDGFEVGCQEWPLRVPRGRRSFLEFWGMSNLTTLKSQDLKIDDMCMFAKKYKQYPDWILGSGTVEQCIGLSLGAQVSDWVFLRWSSEFFSGFGFGTSTGIFASRSLWCAWAKMEV